MIKALSVFPTMVLLLMLTTCKPVDDQKDAGPENASQVTAEQAVKFVDQSEQQLAALLQENERMAWVYSNFITADTEVLAADFTRKYTAVQVELAVEAARYYTIEGLSADTRRKLNLLRSGINMPAPPDSGKTAEQSEIGARLGGMYGSGEYCYANGECLDLAYLSDIMAESRDPEALLEAWEVGEKLRRR